MLPSYIDVLTAGAALVQKLDRRPKESFELAIRLGSSGGRRVAVLSWSWGVVPSACPPLTTCSLRLVGTKARLDVAIAGSGVTGQPQTYPENAFSGGRCTVLQSAVIKSVRRRDANTAVRAGAALWRASPSDAVKRLAITMLEDSTLHPAIPIVAWLVIATSRPGFAASSALTAAYLSILHDVASCEWLDKLPSALPQRTNPPKGRRTDEHGSRVRSADAAKLHTEGSAMPTQSSQWSPCPSTIDDLPATGSHWVVDELSTASWARREPIVRRQDAQSSECSVESQPQPCQAGVVLTACLLPTSTESKHNTPSLMAPSCIDACASILRSLSVRACFGGQHGDVVLSMHAAATWNSRFLYGGPYSSRRSGDRDPQMSVATNVAAASSAEAHSSVFALSRELDAIIVARGTTASVPNKYAADCTTLVPEQCRGAVPAWLAACFASHGLPCTPGEYRVDMDRFNLDAQPLLSANSFPLVAIDHICAPSMLSSTQGIAQGPRAMFLQAARRSLSTSLKCRGVPPADELHMDDEALLSSAIWEFRSGVNVRVRVLHELLRKASAASYASDAAAAVPTMPMLWQDEIRGDDPTHALVAAASTASVTSSCLRDTWVALEPAIDAWCRAYVARQKWIS